MDESEVKMIRDMISSIVEFFDDQREQLGTAKAFYAMLSGKLSRIVGQDPAWTWRYSQGVHAGTIKPSALFATAVRALGAALDEVPAAVVYTVEVRVFTRPGAVAPGAVVLGESRMCARPGCRVMFVPNVPWRKFCTTECCVLDNKERAK